MKKYFIVIAFLLFIGQVYTQNNVTIYGKIENCYFGDGSLRKEWYNTKSMSIKEEVIEFEISGDSSFRIELKAVDEGYTRYWLRLGNEYTHIYLAPGDSIFVTVDANRFGESIKYTGKGAGRNKYRKEVYKMFMNQDIESKYLRKGGPDDFLRNLNEYIDKKMTLLNKSLNSGEIDSAYYQFEKDRIEIYCAAKILRHFIRQKTVYDPGIISKELSLVLKYAESNNSNYLQENDFRSIVRDYPDYKLKFSSGEHKTSVSEKIDFAKKNYKGLVLTYYYHKLIYACVADAASPVERNIVLDYLSKNINDPLSNQLIDEIKQNESNYQTSNGDILEATLVTSIIFVFLVLLLILLSKISRIFGQNNFRFNAGLLIRNSIYLLACIIAITYMKKFHMVGVATVILCLAVFIIHNYVVILKFVAHKKYYHYAAFVILLMIIFVTTLLFLDTVSYQMRSNYFIQSIVWNAVPYIFFGYILIIISWIIYYINILAKKKTTIKNLVKEKRLNLEVAFNTFLVLVSYMIFMGIQGRSSIYQIIPFYTAIILFYLHTFYIIPNYLNKNKIIRLIAINGILLIIIAAGMIIVNAIQSLISIERLGVGVSIIDVINIKNSINIEKLVASMFIIVPAFTYNYIKKQLQNQETNGYKLFRKKEAELEQLRSQVNPHFLFNTLNTLYAFALKEKSEKTADCIAKLANLMRFMIDDMSKDYILLKNEIGYIQDYIKLQSIRSSVEHDIKVNIDVEEDKNYQIAPMLLIPFVENAFKHGINPNEISQLKIDIKAKDNQIQVVIENSIDAKFEAYYKEKGFGIGIDNVKKRLGHIYPGKHSISVAKTEDRFIVIVKIEIKND